MRGGVSPRTLLLLDPCLRAGCVRVPARAALGAAGPATESAGQEGQGTVLTSSPPAAAPWEERGLLGRCQGRAGGLQSPRGLVHVRGAPRVGLCVGHVAAVGRGGLRGGTACPPPPGLSMHPSGLHHHHQVSQEWVSVPCDPPAATQPLGALLGLYIYCNFILGCSLIS